MDIAKIILLLGIAFPLSSYGSSYNIDSERNDQAIPVGGFLLTPLVKFKQGYDDNVTSAKVDPISSWITIFQPSLKATTEFGEFGKHNFEMDWVFTHGAYHASREDSYNDHDVSGKLNYELAEKHRLMAQGGYIQAHEERGSRFSLGAGTQLAEPDTYEQLYGGVQYTYGAPTADARVELELGYLGNDYDSRFIDIPNSTPFDTTAARDRNTIKYGGTAYYKIGAATDLTFELWNSDISYDYTPRPEDLLDSTENRIMVGAKWEATALTTGFAKIGYIKKDFDLETRNTFDTPVWEVEVLWEPKTYSKVKFTTGQTADETNGEGFFFSDTISPVKANVVENTQYAVEWTHQWLERLTSKLGYAISQDEYFGTDNNTEYKVRKDDNTAITAALFYDMNYWLSFSLDYRYTERDSTRDNFVYDRQFINLGARIALF
ncbi:outer membrane beta-barrel protein [Colwellia asteriadis]|uniref:Outer membrane beta-barrel protein n=1 Tax=Colwellia asteriadis TaxID=517723 RepID=A0ABN1L252_9GAMM